MKKTYVLDTNILIQAPYALHCFQENQVVIPLAVFAGCRLAGLDGLPAAVSVVLAAMPAGATTAILASRYECDSAFAASCVTVSTVFSLVAIPVWCMFF